MVDCIVISDDDSDKSPHFDVASLRQEELKNTRFVGISALSTLLESDENNVPDTSGRLSINPIHDRSEQDIFIANHIARQLKPHQISGIRFMYSNLIGSIPHFNAGLSGSGCILAHSMGLGKTLQVIAFLEALFRSTNLSKCLIVAPANTIRSWFGEFNKWLPEKSPANESTVTTTEDESFSTVVVEDDRYRTFLVNIIDDECKTFEDKLAVLTEWTKNGGVLLLSYEMLLSISKTAQRRCRTKRERSGGYIHLRQKTSSQERRTVAEKHLHEFKAIKRAFFCPGPDIVICDEGHRLKSENTEIVQNMREIKTKRRLILTGYPVQNNLLEYWYMVDFIRPNHLGPLVQFKDLFVVPIQRGSATDSVPAEVAQMRERTHILYSLLKGFVHRRPALLLYKHLPPKFEYILSLKMTAFQARIYNLAVARCSMTGGLANKNLLRAFAMAMKISNHPDVFYHFAMKRINVKEECDASWSDEEDFIDSGQTSRNKQDLLKKQPSQSNISQDVETNDTGVGGEWSNWLTLAKRAGFREESLEESDKDGHNMRWAISLLEGYTPRSNPTDSPKFCVLLCLIKHTVLAGDRMLIFSQNLPTLDMIEKILKKTIRPNAGNSANRYWRHNVDYYRFDGSTPGSNREMLVKKFQQKPTLTTKSDSLKTEADGKCDDKTTIPDSDSIGCDSQASLFLISTRAGSLGINLTGANRVCLMDASWNPCQDVQALSRVYRFGQVKPCFVYRLVADCSLERVVYDRQIQKEALSTRVVDDSPANRRFSRDDIRNIFKYYPEEAVVSDSQQTNANATTNCLTEAFSGPVVDQVLLAVLKEIPLLFSRPPQRHDTFREIDPSQRLTDSERRHALLQYENDKIEYEKHVLPTFTKNSRGGAKSKKRNDPSDNGSAVPSTQQPTKITRAPPSEQFAVNFPCSSSLPSSSVLDNGSPSSNGNIQTLAFSATETEETAELYLPIPGRPNNVSASADMPSISNINEPTLPLYNLPIEDRVQIPSSLLPAPPSFSGSRLVGGTSKALGYSVPTQSTKSSVVSSITLPYPIVPLPSLKTSVSGGSSHSSRSATPNLTVKPAYVEKQCTSDEVITISDDDD